MSIDAKRRLASAAFVVLLALSVVWPTPVVSINRLCCNAAIGVDELSFLGREAPRWDVVYWSLAGLLLIAMLVSGEREAASGERLIRFRSPLPARRLLVAAALLAALATALIWRFLDIPITALAESIGTTSTDDAIRLANRFGGG